MWWQDLYEFAKSFWVVWLMLLFIGIIWWTYRPKRRQRYEDAARIPFKED